MNDSNSINRSNPFFSYPATFSIPLGLFGLMLNLLLLFVVVVSKRLKEPTYILIGSVIINDCLSTLQLVIVSLTPLILQNFNFQGAEIFCKILFYTFYSTYNTSVLSLTAISVYRRKILIQTASILTKKQQYQYVTKITVAIWIFGSLVSIPSLFIVSNARPIMASCDITYPSNFPHFTPIYYLSMTFITYIIPIIIITVNYTRIVRQILSKVKPHISIETRKEIEEQRRNEVIKMLIIVTGIFMFFAWPFLICLDVLALHGKTFYILSRENYSLYLICFFTLPINVLVSIFNPVIYILFDKSIRTEVKKKFMQIVCPSS
ncbi:Prokineticin receptor 2 [Trichoplax sp. H2]|nr:Prokineticin receptor 2 [Trichoplax sp. H2]|eukprot:RDD40476.1 Prokineticin receptor 2 [Trichoplax sp. H2]